MRPQKAILIVSFGTGHNDAREKTLDLIGQEIRTQFPDHIVYDAWTGKLILQKILRRDGIRISSVSEAMAQMARDGIAHVVVQPTYVIDGPENQAMKRDVLAYQESFQSIRFGDPLLAQRQDCERVVKSIVEEFWDLSEEDGLVLMGHGTSHGSNTAYTILDNTFKEKGYKNIFVGTVKAKPNMETVIHHLKQTGIKQVCLAPLMIVAGEHIKNDLCGNGQNSWLNILRTEGYVTNFRLKGLGEYTAIRKIFTQHIEAVI